MGEATSDMPELHIDVSNEQYRHLRRLAARADVAPSEIVRAAFDEYVRRHGKKVRIELLRHGWNLFAEEAADEVETARHELDDQAPDREI